MTIDCAIIGGGPAGLSAGIYLRRFHRTVQLFDAGKSRARLIPRTHNYPGFPDGISGDELLQRLRQQFERYGGEVLQREVCALRRSDEHFVVELDGGDTTAARSVLLATGTVDVDPELEGLLDARDRGLIRYCPICDGYEHSDRCIGIFGSDQHGVRELGFISHFTDRVTFLSLCRDTDTTGELEQGLVASGARMVDACGSRIETADGGTTLVTASGEHHHFDAIYCALGTRTRSELALQLGAAHDGNGALQVTGHLETSIPGLYAAGDVVSGLDQLAVAVGQAAIAATAIHNHLPRRQAQSAPDQSTR